MPLVKSYGELEMLREVGVTLEIDDEGRIWRIGRWGTGKYSGTRLHKVKRRRAERDALGYSGVSIMCGGVKKHCLAHHLVWTYFNGVIPEGLEIHHKNGIRDDNRPKNLETLTTQLHRQRDLGKFTLKDVKSIREEYAQGRVTLTTLAARYGVSACVLSRLVRGDTWQNGAGPLSTRRQGQGVRVHAKLAGRHDEIRLLHCTGQYTLQRLANVYGVSRQRIHQIING